MKKIIALVLALVLVLGTAVPAFAVGENPKIIASADKTNAETKVITETAIKKAKT